MNGIPAVKLLGCVHHFNDSLTLFGITNVLYSVCVVCILSRAIVVASNLALGRDALAVSEYWVEQFEWPAVNCVPLSSNHPDRRIS